MAGLHIPLVVPTAGASVLATDTIYLPPISQISGASSAEVTASGLKKEQSLPFLLSEGLPTIPYTIVKKITNGEFVDMAELLRDYNAMFRQQAALDPAVDWSKINSILYAVAQPGT